MEKKNGNGHPISQENLMEEEIPDRGHWGGRFDFILACLGTAVGLGNVWRFPYLTYKNGGGAFVVPYIIMVFVIGLPVFLVELTLGQYSALGPLNVFQNISPLFKGIGYATIIAATLVAIYYNMIIAYTIYYLFDSFRSDMQWQYCHHDFNTENCFNDLDYQSCKQSSANNSGVFFNRTCYNATYAAALNISEITEKIRVAPAEEYLNNYILDKSDGFEDMGNIKWQLLVSLLVSWIIVVICLIKGIKTSGKVVYFTATFPYVILLILFIRGITLEGAIDGIIFFIKPDFQKLGDINVWNDAAIQVFYSFSIAGGGMITYASYNKFNNNLIKDVLIIGFGDMLTSLFSGFVVFSMIGFMAKQLGKNIDSVVQSGTGLAFIVYPDGITRMPVSTLWAILFFFMLFLLGIDSQFAMVETIITFMFDKFPKTRTRKPLIVIGIGLALFLLGIPLTTRGGPYLLEVMDAYAAGWPYLFIGLLECLVVSYVYGAGRFMDDLKEMTGWNPNQWVRSHLIVVLMTLAPVVITVILLMSWIQFKSLTLGEYVFPTWGNAVGWVMAIIPISCIPIAAIHELCQSRSRGLSFISNFKTSLKATDAWRENAKRNTVFSSSISGMGRFMADIARYDNPALTVDAPPQYDSRL